MCPRYCEYLCAVRGPDQRTHGNQGGHRRGEPGKCHGAARRDRRQAVQRKIGHPAIEISPIAGRGARFPQHLQNEPLHPKPDRGVGLQHRAQG